MGVIEGVGVGVWVVSDVADESGCLLSVLALRVSAAGVEDVVVEVAECDVGDAVFEDRMRGFPLSVTLIRVEEVVASLRIRSSE